MLTQEYREHIIIGTLGIWMVLSISTMLYITLLGGLIMGIIGTGAVVVIIGVILD